VTLQKWTDPSAVTEGIQIDVTVKVNHYTSLRPGDLPEFQMKAGFGRARRPD
jgi:hypothetical protein